MRRLAELFLTENLVGRGQLLHHTGVHPHAFLQFLCQRQSDAFQFSHFRLHIPAAANGQCVCGHVAAVGAQDSGDRIPEGGFTVSPAAVGYNHCFHIDFADRSQTDNFLNIVNQLLIVLESLVQGIQPELFALVARINRSDLRAEIIRPMFPPAFKAFSQVVGCRRRVQEQWIVVQLFQFDQHQRFHRSHDRIDVLRVPALHDERLVCPRRQVCEKQFQHFLVQFCRSLLAAAERFLIAACPQESLAGLENHELSIGQLQVKELFGCPVGFLFGFVPDRIVVVQEVCTRMESKLVAVLPLQHLRLTDI